MKIHKRQNYFIQTKLCLILGREILCPFSNQMISLIGSCPTKSRKIPCQKKSVLTVQLIPHLRSYHSLKLTMAQKIAHNYKEKTRKQ